ncbi:MAG: hypothetical protein U0R50_03780 [Gaiellales bacterium]
MDASDDELSHCPFDPVATPLLAALALVAAFDVVFAVDSIPSRRAASLSRSHKW